MMDNLLVRILLSIVMIRWTGLAPLEFEFPFPGSLTSTFLQVKSVSMDTCQTHPRHGGAPAGCVSSGQGFYYEHDSPPTREVDTRLPKKGDSNSDSARPVHLIITMLKWIRNSRLSMKDSLSSLCAAARGLCVQCIIRRNPPNLRYCQP